MQTFHLYHTSVLCDVRTDIIGSKKFQWQWCYGSGIMAVKWVQILYMQHAFNPKAIAQT